MDLFAGKSGKSMCRLEVPIWEDWNIERLYQKGDKVYYKDSLSSYVCIKDLEVIGIPITDTEYWQIIAGGSDWSNLTNEIVVTALGFTPSSVEELDSLAGIGRTNETVKENADDIANLELGLDNLAGIGRTNETVKENADDIANLELGLDNLAGIGRTNETVKENADDIQIVSDNLDEHKADKAKYATFVKSSNQSLANGVDTQIQWDAKNSYNGEDFCEIDSATKQIKITKTGFYQLQISVTFAGKSGGVRIYWGTVLNNTYPSTDTPCYMTINETAYVTAGMLLNMRVTQASGVALDLTVGTSCMVRKVG